QDTRGAAAEEGGEEVGLAGVGDDPDTPDIALTAGEVVDDVLQRVHESGPELPCVVIRRRVLEKAVVAWVLTGDIGDVGDVLRLAEKVHATRVTRCREARAAAENQLRGRRVGIPLHGAVGRRWRGIPCLRDM